MGCTGSKSWFALGLITLVLGCFVGASETGVAQQNPGPLAPLSNYAGHSLRLPFSGRPIGLDDAGDFVASTFIYHPGDKSVALFTGPNGDAAEAMAVSSGGEVFGRLSLPYPQPINMQATMERSHRRHFLYNIHTRAFTSFVDPMNKPGLGYNDIVGINNAKQFVASTNGEANAGYGTLSAGSEGLQFTEIHCTGGGFSHAGAINNRGEIAGSCEPGQSDPARKYPEGFIFNTSTGKMTLLRYPGAFLIKVFGINDSGLVVGFLQAPGYSGGFVYDGAKFSRWTENFGAGCKPAGISNQGDIVGACGISAAIASPSTHPAPAAVAALRPGAIFEAMQTARQHALQIANEAVASGPKPGGTTREPNLPGPIGGVDMGGGFVIGWTYQGSALPGVNIQGVAGATPKTLYLGFDSEGSWIEEQTVAGTYLWDGKRLLAPLHPPRGPLKLPDVMPNPATPASGAAPTAPPPQPSRAQAQSPAAPFAENPTFTKDSSGTVWLSYTLKNFGPTDIPIKGKVVRPVAKAAPTAGLPVPVVGTGNVGSWIWIGEGPFQGQAAVFNMDASGVLTWVNVTPDVAAKYLGK